MRYFGLAVLFVTGLVIGMYGSYLTLIVAIATMCVGLVLLFVAVKQ